MEDLEIIITKNKVQSLMNTSKKELLVHSDYVYNIARRTIRVLDNQMLNKYEEAANQLEKYDKEKDDFKSMLINFVKATLDIISYVEDKYITTRMSRGDLRHIKEIKEKVIPIYLSLKLNQNKTFGGSVGSEAKFL